MGLQSIVLVLASYLVVSNAQHIMLGNGGCPGTNPMSNLDMSKFVGKWYEIVKFPFILDPTGKCTSHTFSPEFFWYKLDYKRKEGITGLTLSNSFPLVNVPFAPNGAFVIIQIIQNIPIPFPLNVYETDYTTYALTGLCIDLGLFNFRLSWALARDPAKASDSAFVTSMKSKFTARNMTTDNMVTTEQSCATGF